MDQRVFSRRDGVGVKICGVTTAAQAEEISALGADAIGFNFWPGSKRYLDPDGAGWLKELSPEVVRVGVFVNAEAGDIRRLLDEGYVDWAQLHGDETPEFVASLRAIGERVFKAIGVKDESSLEKLDHYEGPILIDAYAPGAYGGSGESLDWALGAEAVARYPEREIILAGGLNPGNVGRAVGEVHPAAVDVASGVEISPGIKDLEACRRFVEHARTGAAT